MKKSSELFDLIKALNKQDKKELRQELTANKQDRKTLRLYDIIDKQKTFDDEAAQKKMGNFKWYSRLKNYLSERITNNLLSSIPERESQSHVLRLITLAEILKSKGLPDMSLKKLEQAAEICSKYEWVDIQPFITNKIFHVVEDGRREYQFHDQYIKYYEEFNQYQLFKKYWFLFRIVEFSEGKISKNDLLKYLDIKEILNDEKKLTLHLTKISYYHFLFTYYRKVEVDSKKSHFYFEISSELQTSGFNESLKKTTSSDQLKNLLRNYIVDSSNSILDAMISGNTDSFDRLFDNLILYEDKMSISKSILSFYVQLKYYNYFLIAGAKITRAGIESPDFNNWFQQLNLIEKKLPSKILSFCYDNSTLLFFMQGRWNDCRNAINHILNDRSSYKQNKDTYSCALVLQLFLDYETDQIDLLDSNIKKAERYFENHYAIADFQKIILEFFNKLKLLGDKKSQKKLMMEFRNKIDLLQRSNPNLRFPYYGNLVFIDFDSWLKSKIDNRSFIELKREQAKQT